jgi:hypothetical protein
MADDRPLEGRFRRYDIDIPAVLYARLKKALETAISRSLLPKATTERDFLIGTIFTNGLAMVEADLINKDRESRSVLLPGEIPHGVPAPRDMGSRQVEGPPRGPRTAEEWARRAGAGMAQRVVRQSRSYSSP